MDGDRASDWNENPKGIDLYEPIIILGDRLRFWYGESCRIDSFVKIEIGNGLQIGNYVHIASFCHLGIGGGELFVGNHVGIASGAKILTGSNTIEGLSTSAVSPEEMQKKIKSLTIIGNYVLIGTGAIVMPGVCIGEAAAVGAGAVVTRDVPPCTIVVGNPAKRIGYRKDIAEQLHLDII